jgi:hypothetical protein
MRTLAICTVGILTAVSTLLPAQVDAQQSDGIGTISFDEKFDDPEDSTSKELAKVEGLSLPEARRRLSLMNEASVLDYRLRTRYPRNYAGTLVENKSGFHINFYFAEADPAGVRQQLVALGASPQLMAVSRVGKAPASEANAKAKAERMLRQLEARGIDGTVAWFAPAGRFKLLVKDTTRAAEAIRSRQIEADENVRVEYFEGIQLHNTSEINGGERYDDAPYDNLIADCTLGFTVRSPANVYGVTTAGHCNNTGKWASVSDGLDRNHDMRFQQEWKTNGIDIQWHTVLSGLSYTIVPKFFNGSAMISVTGGQSEYAGLFVCKYGITTKRTCGYVDPYQYLSTDTSGHTYGHFSRFNKHASYRNMSDPGDSGGPVFTGSLAVGHLHGGDPYENVYFTPVRSWAPNNVPINIICAC